MSERDSPYEIKSVADDGTFTGFAAIYGNTDRSGDVIDPGSFAEQLRTSTSVPVLWSHDRTQPVGLGQLSDSEKGLIVNTQLDLDVQAGREAYSRIKKRIATGLSIGFHSLKDSIKDGVRHLQRIELFEVSVVLFPANPAAQIVHVKSELPRDGRSAEKFLHDLGYKIGEAKYYAFHGWKNPYDEQEQQKQEIIAWIRSQKGK